MGNLSWSVNRDYLRDYMRTAGEIIFCDIMADRDGRSRGCGIVVYTSPEEARTGKCSIDQCHCALETERRWGEEKGEKRLFWRVGIYFSPFFQLFSLVCSLFSCLTVFPFSALLSSSLLSESA